MRHIHIIGGGLAGCEAAWQLARRNVECILYEMRPQIMTEAHVTSNLAELVCSNSFRSDDSTANAVGVLHEEMRRCDSLIMKAADTARLPAGSALAVDRHLFSESVEEAITEEKKASNSWLRLSLREGKNREIRRVMSHIGLEVSRLIRVSYGPFHLGNLPRGGLQEIPASVIEDQTGSGKKFKAARSRSKQEKK